MSKAVVKFFISLFLVQFVCFIATASPVGYYAEDCFKRKKGKKFTLVEQRKPQCPIIVSKDISPRTMDAVNDLKAYLQKISGAEFKIIVGKPSTIPEKAIWIGYHDSFKRIFKKVKFDLKLEEIMIVANQNHLAILGDDGPNGLVKDVVIETELFPNAQASYGTINAIYTFLQDFLGVRWFWPGETGEDYQQTDNLVIDAVEFRYQPQMTLRYGVTSTYRPGRRTRMREGDTWSARQRLFYSSTIIHLGHPFKEWWSKYSNQFPDIFALTVNGNRKPINEGKDVKFCVSNPELPKLWIQDLEEKLKSFPFLKFINVGENDSYHTGHCVCDVCTKLDVVSVHEKDKILSDRHAYYANRLYEALESKFGKKSQFQVLYFAYGNNRALPLKTKLNQNIGIISVHNFHRRRTDKFDVSSNDQMQQYLDWSKQVKTIFWRPNLGNPVGLTWGFYDVAFSQSFENFKFVADNNCKGVYFDLYRDHWATQGIQYYTDGQLAWNPNANKDALLKDYFLRMYGPAHQEMQQFWHKVEQTRNALFDKHGNIARLWVHEWFDETWYKEAEILIQNAEAKLSKADKKFRERLDFTRKGLVYTKYLVELRALMVQIEGGNNKAKADINDVVKQLNAFVANCPKEAINFKVLNFDMQLKFDKQMANRMEGLIPNAPITKKTLKLIDEEGLE